MADRKRKIKILDEHGLLSRRALLAFANNELPPDVHDKVRKLIEEDEMYQDALEGVREVNGKDTANAAIFSLNEKIAATSGAEPVSVGGSFHVLDFLQEYRKVAAVLIALILVAAAVITVSLLQTEKESVALQQQKENVREEIKEEPTVGKNAEQEIKDEKNDATADQEKEREIFVDDAEEDVGLLEKTEVPAPTPPKEVKTPKSSNDDFAAAGQNQKSAATPTAGDKSKAEILNPGARQKTADIESNSITNLAEPATDDHVSGKVFAMAEVMPEFPGGDAAIRHYIRENMSLSKRQQKKIADAKVYISFVVDAGGNVKDVRVVKGAEKIADAEAVRIISSMPRWEPGMQNGEPVPVKQYFTIDFSER